MTWNHPNMPWDESMIYKCSLKKNGKVNDIKFIAGGEKNKKKISVQQPRFSPSGELFYISDISGWWNLYKQDEEKSILPLKAEFGRPQWSFGLKTYDFIDLKNLVFIYSELNQDNLGTLNLDSGSKNKISINCILLLQGLD